MGWAGSVEVVGISAFACFVECIERAATIPTWGRRAARRAALETELLKTESDMVMVEVRDRELLTVLNDEEDQFKAGSSHWVHPGTAGAWSRRPAERRDTVPRSGQWPTRAYQFPAKTLGGCTLAHAFCPSCPLRVLQRPLGRSQDFFWRFNLSCTSETERTGACRGLNTSNIRAGLTVGSQQPFSVESCTRSLRRFP